MTAKEIEEAMLAERKKIDRIVILQNVSGNMRYTSEVWARYDELAKQLKSVRGEK